MGKGNTHALRHGAWSKHIRKRYTDKRTREGKRLQAITKGIVDDFGGESKITNAQRLILAGIQTKLIVLMQIGAFVDKQDSILEVDGSVIPALRQNFTTFSESLRRDLETLFHLANKKPTETPNLNDYIKAKKGKYKR